MSDWIYEAHGQQLRTEAEHVEKELEKVAALNAYAVDRGKPSVISADQKLLARHALALAELHLICLERVAYYERAKEDFMRATVIETDSN